MTRTHAPYHWPFLTALLLYASFPPLNLWPLAWAAPIPLTLYVLKEERKFRLFFMPWAAGFAFFAVGLNWVKHVAPVGPWILALYFAFYFPLYGLVVRALRLNAVPLALACPVAWISGEWLRSWLMTGLPWFELGHTQADFFWLAQVADLGGVPLVGALMAATAGAAADRMLGKARWTTSIVVAAFVAGACGYGAWRAASLPRRDGPVVGIVQPNIAQDAKVMAMRTPHDWSAARAEVHRTMERMTRDLVAGGARPDVVVWPESSYLNALVWDLTKGAFVENAAMTQAMGYARLAGAPLVLGCEVIEVVPGERGSERLLNSAVLIDPARGPVGRYSKMHLVPFGEYIPWPDVIEPIVKAWTKLERLPRFRTGAGYAPVEGMGFLICFEFLFPDAAREQTRNGATILVNGSNEGWFKESPELDQSLAISRFRAIETRRGFVRATNTGISAVIDPDGRVAAAIEGKSVAGLLVRRTSTTELMTPFVRFGSWVGAGAGILGILGLLAGAARLAFSAKEREHIADKDTGIDRGNPRGTD